MSEIKVIIGSGRSDSRGITSLFFKQAKGKWQKPFCSCTIHGLETPDRARYLWAKLLADPKAKPIISRILKQYEIENGRTNKKAK